MSPRRRRSIVRGIVEGLVNPADRDDDDEPEPQLGPPPAAIAAEAQAIASSPPAMASAEQYRLRLLVQLRRDDAAKRLIESLDCEISSDPTATLAELRRTLGGSRRRKH